MDPCFKLDLCPGAYGGFSLVLLAGISYSSNLVSFDSLAVPLLPGVSCRGKPLHADRLGPLLFSAAPALTPTTRETLDTL